MKILYIDQGSERWFKEKLGKVSGSTFGKVISERNFNKDQLIQALLNQGLDINPKDTIPKLLPLLNEEAEYQLFKDSEKKRGFWKILAERLFDPVDEEDARDRGNRLEDMACERFEKESGKKTTKAGICISDEDENMIVSPDRLIFNSKKVVTEALETKNYEDAHHVEAVVTQKVPKDLWPQLLQYFIVIETLQKLHLVFHTDRTANKKLQYYCITINRKDILDKIEYYKKYELSVLRLMNELVEEYAF